MDIDLITNQGLTPQHFNGRSHSYIIYSLFLCDVVSLFVGSRFLSIFYFLILITVNHPNPDNIASLGSVGCKIKNAIIDPTIRVKTIFAR
jgi:hypothetical protein